MEKVLIPHHSGTNRDTTSIESIRQYFIRKGKPVYYNWIIDVTGKTHEEHRRWNYRGGKGVSQDVCLAGNFTREKPHYDQLIALQLLNQTHDFDRTLGHKQAREQGFYATASACPGNLDYDEWQLNPTPLLQIKLTGDSRPVHWKAVRNFFLKQIDFAKEGDWHILCELSPGPFRAGHAYGPTQFKRDGYWKITVDLSEEPSRSPNGNPNRFYTYEEIIIHEILHELWWVAGLGDIHDHKTAKRPRGLGVRDNNDVFEILKAKITKPLHSLFTINKAEPMNRIIRFQGQTEVYEEVASFELEHIANGQTLNTILGSREVEVLDESEMLKYKKVGIRAHFAPTDL